MRRRRRRGGTVSATAAAVIQQTLTMTACDAGGLRRHEFIVGETRRVSVRAMTRPKPVVVDRDQPTTGRLQRQATGSAGPATAAERPVERLAELGAQRRVEDEVNSAVDHDEQVAEVAADGQLEPACLGQCARRRDHVDAVELQDGLGQLADEEDDDDADQHHRDVLLRGLTICAPRRLTLHADPP